MRRFQFHTGSIKSACVIRMITLSPLFQFHTGSIKSHSAANDCDSVGEFQFHTGSIKSMSLGIPKPTHSHACFNSILVRLKVQATVNDFLRFAKFQFHTGSIKSYNKTDPNAQVAGFNSILVRLKGFMKTVTILYAILTVRVKLIFISLIF